jgi:hypothetical protein
MVDLEGTFDYVLLFALAAALGAVGGLVYELTLTRGGQTGRLEYPHRTRRFRDLGYLANMILGAVAAIAALSVFPPDVKTSVDAAGQTVSTTEYDLVSVVALSLIIGSAGGGFLSAMQARTLALVNAQKTKQTEELATGQLDAVEDKVRSEAPTPEVIAQLTAAKKAIASVRDSGPGNASFE